MTKNQSTDILPWKSYAFATLKAVALFYISTFCLGVFFTHDGAHSILQMLAMILLYLFVIGTIVKGVIDKFSVAALMLIVPIAPLLALIFILSMLPLWQRLH